jgi:hypothetical protein
MWGLFKEELVPPTEASVASRPPINPKEKRMTTKRETATMLAALLYWREELCPHGAKIMRPYFKAVGAPRARALSPEEIKQLSARLRASLVK